MKNKLEMCEHGLIKKACAKCSESGAFSGKSQCSGSVSKFDWLIYKLFYWRWNRIFVENPELWFKMVQHGEQFWENQEEVEVVVNNRPCASAIWDY